MINLKGMTWDHSRGFDPMIATSKKFQKIHNNKVKIDWDKRPLQAFADRPIEVTTNPVMVERTFNRQLNKSSGAPGSKALNSKV